MKQVWKYLKKYRVLLLFSILLALLSVGLTLYIPILTGEALDLIIEQGKVDFAGLSGILQNMLIAIGLTAVAQWVMNVCNNYITCGVVHQMRKEAFANLNRLPLSFTDNRQYGDIVSRLTADVDQFSDGLLMGLTQFFSGIMTILMTLVFMFRLSVGITVVVIVMTPISLVVAAFIAKRSFHLFSAQTRIRGEQTGYIDEMIGNKKIVQAFSQEENVIEEFKKKNEDLRAISLKAIFMSSTTNPSTRFVNGLIYAVVGLFGSFLAVNKGITVGQLSCFLSYANQYTKPFNEISGVVTEMQNALACANRVFEIIKAKPEKEDAPDAVTLKDVKGEVKLCNVSFSYVPEKPLIRDFNLTVKPGQKVAIVGPTGCGKTTLINLLMRFYEVGEGDIKVDGVSIQDMTRASLRETYGMVLQETWLRNESIMENIRMGNPFASDEEVIEAAKASYAHGFIKRLTNGYHTVINEDGGNLSQGQKQLLCIARVMLQKPDMLILDEATSSIDTRTEIKIQSAFAKLMEGRTSFIVAHRLSTIQDADIILVMRDGNIVEQGNHEELLNKGGFYHELYYSQFKH
ncbi:MAG: ABC transporter ATP-binding protein [Lachnospiraceae bacterium]|nr:ABC transporter ATP-binding protein [Lachnospiraceae bacterium]